MTKQLPQTTELFCPTLGNTGIASLPELGSPNYSGPQQVANFDIRTPMGQKMFLSAAGDTELKGSSLNGEVFELVYWMAERAQFLDEQTGDTVPGVRVNLWDKTGRRLTASSWAVARFLDRLVKCFGNGPYDPPMGLTIQNHIRDDGKRSYKIDLVEIPADAG